MYYHFMQHIVTVAMATKQTESPRNSSRTLTHLKTISLVCGKIMWTKPWEGSRLIHISTTLTLMLSATLKGVVPSSKGQSRSNMVVPQNDMTGFTCVGHGAGMEQCLSPELTGFTAAEAFHAVTQLVLQLWQHMYWNMLSGAIHRVKFKPSAVGPV